MKNDFLKSTYIKTLFRNVFVTLVNVKFSTCKISDAGPIIGFTLSRKRTHIISHFI